MGSEMCIRDRFCIRLRHTLIESLLRSLDEALAHRARGHLRRVRLFAGGRSIARRVDVVARERLEVSPVHRRRLGRVVGRRRREGHGVALFISGVDESDVREAIIKKGYTDIEYIREDNNWIE